MPMAWEAVIRTHAGLIADHWSGLILSTYPADAARLFSTRKDPFANPVGGTVRGATRAILDETLDPQSDRVREALHDLVRIRAVQDFSPSQAVGVVFLLKRALRVAWGDEPCPLAPSDLAALDDRVEALALMAFDLYAADRERIAEIRVRESHRAVHRLLARAGLSLDEPVAGDPDDPDRASPPEATT